MENVAILVRTSIKDVVRCIH